MKQYARIFRYLKVYKGKVALYFLFIVLSIIFSIVSVGMLMPFLQLIFTGEGTFKTTNNPAIQFFNNMLLESLKDPNNKVPVLGYICVLMISFIIMKNLFLYLSYYILNPLKNTIVNELRQDLYDKVLKLPIGFFTEKRKGDLMSRMTNDVGEVEGSVVGTLEGWIRDPLTIIINLTVLFLISPQMTLFILILIPVLGLVIGRVTKSLKRHSEEAAKKSSEALSTLEETLGGLRVIKAFNVEKLMRSRFRKNNEELLHAKNHISYRRDMASPLSEVMGVMLFTIVLYYGGRLVLQNELLEASVFLGYLAIFYNIINPAKALSTSFSNMRKGAAAIGRIEEVLTAPVTVDENPNGKQLTEFRDKIEFRNVRFAYDDAVILDDINLTVQKGKTIALVGSSGAGKSPLPTLYPDFMM